MTNIEYNGGNNDVLTLIKFKGQRKCLLSLIYYNTGLPGPSHNERKNTFKYLKVKEHHVTIQSQTFRKKMMHIVHVCIEKEKMIKQI